MRHRSRALVTALSLALVVSVGCTKEPAEPVLEPTIAPPVIGEAGVLRVGVDLDYPPFAAEVDGQKVGIDVDVAAAVAERLGLQLELIDVKPGAAPAALSGGRVDIALGAISITDVVLADVSSAGSYILNAPALFSSPATGSAEPTPTAEALPALRVGAQEGSPAFWSLEREYDPGFAIGYPTLREAFAALVAGDVDVVVGDALVGGYIIRDMPDVVFAGQYAPAVPLGVMVAKDATELEGVVRSTLDALAAEGVLDAIRAKWLGELPKLQAAQPGESEETTETAVP